MDADTEAFNKEARAYAQQMRKEGEANGNLTQTLSTARTVLRKMKADLDVKLLGDTKELEGLLGPNSSEKVHAYLFGPLAASAQVISIRSHSKGAK